jgi:hypothetical protein
MTRNVPMDAAVLSISRDMCSSRFSAAYATP